MKRLSVHLSWLINVYCAHMKLAREPGRKRIAAVKDEIIFRTGLFPNGYAGGTSIGWVPSQWGKPMTPYFANLQINETAHTDACCI